MAKLIGFKSRFTVVSADKCPPYAAMAACFVSNILNDGRRFHIHNVIDDFTRECLAIVITNSLSSVRVVREFDRIAEGRGYPLLVVSDNGSK